MRTVNIIITAGGTSEKIDQVRRVTNMSTGKLGNQILEQAYEFAQSPISNIQLGSVYYLCSKHAIQPMSRPGLQVVNVESVSDLQNAIVGIMTTATIDYFIHSMAISDYTTDYVSNSTLLSREIVKKIMDSPNSTAAELEYVVRNILQNGDQARIDTSQKISSQADDLFVRMKQTPKIISLIKKLQPHTFLVGFKLLTGVTEEHLFDVGFNLLRKNRCNLVLANDLELIKQGIHTGMLIYPEKKYDLFVGKDKIAENLVATMFKRGEVRHPQSVQVHHESYPPHSLLQSMRVVGSKLGAGGFLPVVEGGTYGNMSVRDGEGFYITGRNVNKANLERDKVCYISNVNFLDRSEHASVYAAVYYAGSCKPSIDTAIHARIYGATNAQAILHVHTDRVFAGIPITDYNYPCGSEQETESILKAISSLEPGQHIIQMYKHGLLVFGESLEWCHEQLINLFENGVSVEPLVIDSDREVFAEWLEHFAEVYQGAEEALQNPKNFSLVRRGGQKVGLVYIDPKPRKLRFALYTLKSVQGKKLGIGEATVDILTALAGNYGVSKLALITTDKCGVADYYTNKLGFHEDFRGWQTIELHKQI